ncbi:MULTISPECIES: hypothetical protein [Xanthomonas]|uniref:hypothetical protein n=1 Tax=Xanthomonas TaxID=338 RepID=UPI001115997D|nr:hypothetical protein [Xanthomonas campestris]MCC5093956.1 hypothetical protein [Xanthomonas campestris pv. incanae]MEA9611913.1 hypothetical protein [Xanthomonas campestris pv. incanae]MEA9621438.1 hypothetical protein [Xanthomonas campestris pv. incanae]WDJ09552.1 hypothetical protein JH299_18720 [Xanthomonas campestris pv. incanae]
MHDYACKRPMAAHAMRSTRRSRSRSSARRRDAQIVRHAALMHGRARDALHAMKPVKQFGAQA